MNSKCDICGKTLHTERGLKAHISQAHAQQGEAYQSSLIKNNTKEEEVLQTTENMEKLADLFKGQPGGLFQAPLTEDQQKSATLDSVRRTTVQTMQVLIEIATLLHPERLESLLTSFEEEPDFRRILILDWLDWTYRSYGQVHVLEGLMVKALQRQYIDSGILSDTEEIPEAPKTKLGPVLEELASRIQARR